MANLASSTGPHDWREGAISRPRRSRSGAYKRGILAALIFAILAGVGSIGGLIWWYWPGPEPLFFTEWVEAYQDPRIPHDATMARDGRALTRALGDRVSEERWQEGIRRAGEDRPVVISLSAYACTDADGDVRILSDRARPGRFDQEPTLRGILEALGESPARHKLLILDLMRPLADPRLGVLDDEIASGVQAALEEVPDEHRMVLCAAAPGQVAHLSEPLGRSIFGYYVEQGLRGAADNAGGSPDGVVTARELADYVRARVDAWSAHNLALSQTPTLYGSQEDFLLVRLGSGGSSADLTLPDEEILAARPEPAAEAGSDAKIEEDDPNQVVYPDWLLSGWKTRDAWWSRGDHRVAPYTFRRMEAALLRAERSWRLGAEPEAVRAALQADLPAGPPAFSPSRPTAPRSLGLALTLARRPDPATTPALRAWLAELRKSATGETPLDPPAAAQAFLDANQALIGQDPEGLDLAWSILTTVSEPAGFELPDVPERLHLLAALAGATRPLPLSERFIEMHALTDLAPRVDLPSAASAEMPAVRGWAPKTVQMALETIHQAELADSRADSFPQLRGALEQASQRRHAVELMLRAPGYVRESEIVPRLDDLKGMYRDIHLAQQTVESARRRLDEAWAVLPTYLDSLTATPHPEPVPGDWFAAIQEAGEVAELLREPTNDGLARLVEILREKDRTLGRLLGELRRPYEPEKVEELIERADGPAEAAAYASLDAVLRTPFPLAEDRARLWAAGRQLARRLHLGTPETAPGRSSNPPGQTGPDPMALDRARASIRLLELGGLDPAELQSAYDGYESQPGHGSRAVLARALSETWTTRLAGLLAPDSSPEVVDRASRIYPPFQVSRMLGDPSDNPSTRLAARRGDALWAWLADRYRYEERAFGSLGLRVDLFRKAAEECAALAGSRPEGGLQLVSADLTPPRLAPDVPSATANLRLTLDPSRTEAETRVELDAFSPDDRLDVTLREPSRVIRAGASELIPVDFRFREHGAGGRPTAETPVDGVLVLATLGHRVYPLKLPIAGSLGALPPELILSADPNAPSTPVDEVLVRPTTASQPFYLFLSNPSERERTVSVQIRTGEKAVTVAEAAMPLPANSPPLRVEGLKAPASDPADADRTEQDPQPGLNWIPLDDPDRIHVLLRYDEDRDPVSIQIPVTLASPSDYLRVIEAGFTPGDRDAANELMVRIVASGMPRLEPPCSVALNLPLDQIPPLIEDPRTAERLVTLANRGDQRTLFAREMRLSLVEDSHGIFYLDVDDHARAVKYGVHFLQRGERQNARPVLDPEIRRLRTGSSVLPRDGMGLPVSSEASFPITVEVDNPPRGSTLLLSLESLGPGVADTRQLSPMPAKRRSLEVAADPETGALVFRGAIHDQEIEWDVRGLRDSRRLVARLLDASGNAIDSEHGILLFDDRPPERVAFVELASSPLKFGTTTLDVQARGFAACGIRSVNFFVGDLIDGKPPEGIKRIPGEPSNKERTLWKATLPLSGTEIASQAIGVEFVNELGKSTVAGAVLRFQAPPAPPPGEDDPQAPPAPTVGSVEGVVREGPRTQQNLVVYLIPVGENGPVQDKAINVPTDAGGKFEFKDVAPGAYSLYTVKAASRTRASRDVQVEAGKVTAADLKLLR